MASPQNPNLLDRLIQTIPQIHNRKQLVAFLFVVGLFAWGIFNLYAEPPKRMLVIRRNDIPQLVELIKEIGADGVVVYRNASNGAGLSPIYISDQMLSGFLSEAYYSKMLGQLRLGNCVKQVAIAQNSKGVKLDGLVCPVSRLGAIAGVWIPYKFPLKQAGLDGGDPFDPTSARLYGFGQDLSDR
jgi:hypothetical protein